MKINAGEIRVGMLLEYKNDLWQVLKIQHVKPGKGGAFAQVEMKSVNKNTKLNERFRSSETIEKASLEETNFTFSYEDQEKYFFINPKTFEQTEIQKSLIGEKGKLLTENLEVTISFLKKARKITNTPIVAIGGINSTNYKNLLLNKANFLAISGYIWKNKKIKPIEAIKKFK